MVKFEDQSSNHRISSDRILQGSIKTYIQSTPDQFSSNFDPGRATWEDVFEQLQNVENSYEDKGNRSAARRLFRHGTAISQTALPLLEAVPEDHGLGLLKGALIVVLKVC